MRTARLATTGKSRALLVALAFALTGGTATPWAPTAGGRAVAQSGAATVANRSEGVPLRAEPDYGAETLAVLDVGTIVELRTEEADTVYDADGVTRWWPVLAAGEEGWVSGFFLQIPGLPDAVEVAADVPEPAPEDVLADGAAVTADASEGLDLAGTAARVADPDGVNLRAEPSTGAPSLAAVAFAAVVELRIDEADTVYGEGVRWWPVRFEGLDGWIVGDYLAPLDAESAPIAPPPSEPAPGPEPEPEPAPAPIAEAPLPPDVPVLPVFVPGSYVTAVTDDGTGLNIRVDGAPDAEPVGFVPEGDVVQVMDGPFPDPTGIPWYLITDGEVSGFVTGVFLVEAGQPAPPVDEPPPPVPEPPSPPPIAEPAPAPPAREPAGLATGSFQYPVADFTFTQAYGCSPYWFEPFEPAIGCNFHNGIDLANSSYTPLLAADGGVVEYSGWCDCGLGYYVKIDHGNGFKTLYGHMAEQPPVAAGQALRRGDVIGPMGSTGNSTGPHVHFMIELNGGTVDPLGYL